MADIGIQYQSVARGDLDLMLMAWLPGTHRDYWSRIRDRVLDLGPMYSGRLGWIVPDYVPETVLNSIEQLKDPDLATRFANRVQGIDPGSGLNQASLEALKRYGLKDVDLVASSSAAMAAVLASCGGGGGGSAPPIQPPVNNVLAEASIGPAGGTLRVESGDNAGLELNVPAGAVVVSTSFRVLLDRANGEIPSAFPVFRFEPESLDFSGHSVTVTVPASDAFFLGGTPALTVFSREREIPCLTHSNGKF